MSRIAICAPATPITREDAARVLALAVREFPGATLDFHEQCFVEDGHFAGGDAVRLAALLDCANDPAFDAVWLAKGGYGTNRIAVEAVSSMNKAAQSKTYLGYSDGGYLLAELYRRGIGRPVHGPMPVDIRRNESGHLDIAGGKGENGEDAVRRTLSFLVNGVGAQQRAGQTGVLEPTLDQRPAVAFNLTTLAMLAGTPWMPDLSGHVVMVEEVAEHLYAIDRLFFHLTACLKGAAGLRLGRISAVPENDRPFGANPEEIARYWCGKAGIPFLGSADIGHDCANRVVPFGLAGLAPPQ